MSFNLDEPIFVQGGEKNDSLRQFLLEMSNTERMVATSRWLNTDEPHEIAIPQQVFYAYTFDVYNILG